MTVCKMVCYSKTMFKLENFAAEVETMINKTIESMNANGYKYINSTATNLSTNSIIVYLFFDNK
jgi:hypothetical protein